MPIEITRFVLARSASPTPQGGLNLRVAPQRFLCPKLPITEQLLLFTFLEGADLGGDAEISFRFARPDGGREALIQPPLSAFPNWLRKNVPEIDESQDSVVVPAQPTNLAPGESRTLIQMAELTFFTEGRHGLWILVDGHDRQSIDMDVVLIEDADEV